jgi:Uma2 family endonuclease
LNDDTQDRAEARHDPSAAMMVPSERGRGEDEAMVARRKQQETAVNGAAAGAPRPVRYPESDGKPMGETETHIREIMRLIQTLDRRFADRDDVYVGGDLLVYYEEGNPRAVVVPDVFVAIGAAKGPRRRIWKLWEERIPPTLVIEVTSSSTRREDLGRKRKLYARLGVSEYVLYDPLGEYLRPALQGYRLESGRYEAMPAEQGVLVSEVLAAVLQLEDGSLQLQDRRTGAPLLDPQREAERLQALIAQEVAARHALEAEVAELRAMVQRLTPPTEA